MEEFANGRKPVTEGELELIKSIAVNVKNHAPSYQLLHRCPKREICIVWVDKETGLACKSLIDFAGDRLAGDLKTSSRMENKYQMMRDIKRYQYDMQFAFYFDGARAVGLDTREFHVIFAGTKEDCDVAKFKCSKRLLEQGRYQYREALKRYMDGVRGVRRGAFPFDEEIDTIEPAFSGEGA